MTEPVWLPRSVVLAVQEELLARFGGPAGVRDEGLLDSALGRPLHLYTYGTPSVFALAATYAHGIVKNHPFVDGNKRIGFMAAYIFLASNGYELEAPEEDAVLHTLALAAGSSEADEYAVWLERYCVRRSV